MNENDLWQLSAVELGRRFREKSLTPTEVAEASLARMDAVNPRLNAVVARRDDGVRADAQAATARHAAGRALSPLDGVPLTVKDSLLTSDLPTTWGTLALRGHLSPHDELSVARVRAAGALVIGKTNVPEFTVEGYTANPVFGVTRNPWDLRLTPGGSSGGAVAGLAAGIAPLAIAQDAGGSIRRPASHTGVVGLKPSRGAVPREHVLGGVALDFEVVGPMARTVADTRLLFDILRGPDAIDRASLAAAYAASQPARPQPLRMLYVERLGDAPLDPEIAHSVGRAVDRLSALGHDVRRGALPLELGAFTLGWAEAAQIGLARLFQAQPAWAAQASPKYLEMAERGRALPATRLWQILELVAQLRRDVVRLFADTDVIVMPAAAALPWPAEDVFPPLIDGREAGPRGHAVYTGWVNGAGLPALALPCEPSRAGLPIGLQLIGPCGADAALLDLGEAFEAAQPWASRWPALAVD